MSAIITRAALRQWGACYVGDEATAAQRELLSRLPEEGAPLVAILACEDVPWRDRVWVAAHADLALVLRWALWCAGTSLRYWTRRYPEDRRVRDCLRVTARYARGRATRDELWTARSAAAAADAAYAADAASRARCRSRLVEMARRGS